MFHPRALLLLALLLFALPAPLLAQTTFTVDTTADGVDDNPGDGFCATGGGACTLRAAIMETNFLAGDDTILLPAGTYVLDITGPDEDACATGDLDIGDNLIIDGDGAGVTIVDGDRVDRVFHVFLATVTIRDVTVRNGLNDIAGGGIANEVGILQLEDSVVIDNITFGTGGGIANGGGELVVSRSSILENVGECGGGIDNDGVLTVTNSTITDNNALCEGGGILVFDGFATINNSTFAFNSPENLLGFNDQIALSNSLLITTAGGVNCTIDDAGFGDDINDGGNFAAGEACDTIPVTPGAELVSALTIEANGQRTFRPLVGNPVIGGAGEFVPCEVDDQRGITRPGGEVCTSGAVDIVPLFITSADPADAAWGVPYTHTFVATGEPPFTFSLNPGPLPAGLSLSAAGVITGTPTALGPFAFTVHVIDAVGQELDQATSITVTGTPASITGTPPDATWNTAYTFAFGGTGNGTLTYSLLTGTLPDGLSLSTAGVISGTPTGLGPSEFTVRVTDETLLTADSATLTITVTGTAASITGTPPDATWNTPYNFAFGGTGNGTLTYSLLTGTLPDGLALSSAGVISGTPTGLGPSSFTVRVTDVTLQTADSPPLGITVTGTAASITGTPPGATWNTPYNFAFGGTGNGTLTYSLLTGTLPDGLSLSGAGVISGTPTGLGPSSFTVRVTDVTMQTADSPALGITVTGTAASITGTPTPATWNVAYNFAFSGGGNGALTYSLFAGTLPDGLSLSSAGVVSGTPTTLGTSDFTVRVTDATSQTADLPTSITVTGTAASITGTPTPATWNVAYNFAFSGGGNGALTYSLFAGTLPDGLSLSSAGVVSGTPTALGTSNFTVRVTDATSQTADLPTSITVTGTAASITGTPTPATWNVAYNFAFSGGGNGALTYSLFAGSLPAGLSLSGAGVVSGTPTALGTSDFTVRVTDATSQTADLPTSITVTGTAASISGTPPAASLNTAYAFTFGGTGNGALSFAVTAGALPPGLALSAAGAVSGTPTTLGTFTFTVTVTDATLQTASLPTSIAVTGTAIGISGTPPATTVGTAYTFTFTGTGNGALTFSLESGALPAGISFSAAGVLSGTPSAAGTFPFTVRVTDAIAQTTTLATALTVSSSDGGSTVGLLPATLPLAHRGQAYQFRFEMRGNSPTLSLVGGRLPAGMQLSGDGQLSGTPTETGSFPLTLEARDNSGSAQQSYMLRVSGPPTLTGLADRNMEANRPLSISIGVADDFTNVDQVTVTVAASDGPILSGVTLSGNGATRTLQLTPAEDRIGPVTITLTASDGVLSSTLRAVVTVTPAGVPNPPTDFTATPTAGGVLFSWQGPITGPVATFFVFEGGNGAGLTTLPVVNTGHATSYETVVPAGTWFFRARSGNGSGTSAPSNEIGGTIAGVNVPGPPLGLVASVSGSQVQLAWQPPAAGGPATTWQLEAGSAPGASDRGVFALPAVQFTAGGSVIDGEYFVRLRGVNAAGAGPASNEVRFTVGSIGSCAVNVPDPPVLLPASVANNLVTLTWRPPLNTAVSSYRIFAGSQPGLSDLATFDVGAVTSFAAVGPAGSYYIGLLAMNACGTSSPSNIIVLSIP